MPDPRTAAKVDAGEPVEIEPGGYQRIGVEDAWRLLRGAMPMPAGPYRVSANHPIVSEWAGPFGTDRYIPGDCDVCDGWHPEAVCPRSPLRFDDLKPDVWSAGDPDPGFGRDPAIPDSWRWAALAGAVAVLAVWRWAR